MNAPTLANNEVATETGAPVLDPEQVARAGVYGLLARVLIAAPGEDVLERLRAIPAPAASHAAKDGVDMTRAWAVLKLAAEHASPELIDDEFHVLFIGLGRGELVPYGSWYLTGFLMERPLSVLRDDLKAMGFERADDTREPEDHAGFLCDVMAQMVYQGESVEVQRGFFQSHIEPWMRTFFLDLEQAQAAVFYRAIGCLGASFMALEQRYLAMDV